jgi:Zn-dependent peptidase ImmA (M78 family)
MSKMPMAEANRISALLRAVFPAADRFPVDVKMVAKEVSLKQFPGEPITQIDAMDIPGFEGMLARHPSGKRWKIGYNDRVRSEGRIRFTLAHEFGHYLLHRSLQPAFECSQKDMYDWDSGRNLEVEADQFASYLLMPLDDFRLQVGGQAISMDLMLHCADRYGVSPMAAALKWIEIAPRRAIVVAARDGFVLWARSNKAALKSGAYLAAKRNTIEVPAESLLRLFASSNTGHTAKQPANIWFPREPAGVELVEHIYVSDGYYPYTLGLLLLPDAIPKWELPDDDLLEPLDALMRSRS